MERTHHHHFTGTNDVSHRRIHLRRNVLKVDTHDRAPCFLHIRKHLREHHLYNSNFSRRKLTAFYFCVTTITTKEVVHQFKNQFGIQNKECRTAQRPHFHQVETGRYVQGMYVLTELEYLNPPRRHVSAASQEIEHTDARVARKAFVDHFKRWHTPTNDTILTGYVIGT